MNTEKRDRMIIGIPREIKNNENRVAITPAGADALAGKGHKVIIERGAGEGSGIADEEYVLSGASIIDNAKKVYAEADVIVKVKEPVEKEYDLLKEGQILFTYLHLAPNPALTKTLLKKRITAIAYETVQRQDGSLPLLAPMSEVAGRMSVQIGAMMLLKYSGGEGVLLGGVPGVLPAEVLIIGGGVVGTNAAKIAAGMGARVTVADINATRLAYIDDLFSGKVNTVIYSRYSVAELVKRTDLLVGAVLVTGAKAPRTVTEEMVKTMKKGSVIVDVAIDQGGSIETIDRVTTHDNPCYEKYGVIHYAVANMPGAAPRTSTYALTGVTLPYIEKIASFGAEKAMLGDNALFFGLNTYRGHITYGALKELDSSSYLEEGECRRLLQKAV
jgi:alanine dehydrogenase